MIPGYHTAGLLMHDLGVAIDELAHMGFSCVAIRPHGGKLNPTSPAFGAELLGVADALSKAHVRSILEIDAPFLQDPRSFRGPSLVANDPTESQAAKAWVMRWVEVAEEIGSKLVTFSSGQASESDFNLDEEILERLSAQLDGLVQHAAERGIELALRPHGGDAIATVAQFERLAQWLATPQDLRLAADIGEMLSGGELPVVDRLIRNRDRLACVYLCDRRAGVAGDQRIGHGDVALGRILRSLNDNGFDGPAVVRVEGHCELGLIPAREAIELFEDRC